MPTKIKRPSDLQLSARAGAGMPARQSIMSARRARCPAPLRCRRARTKVRSDADGEPPNRSVGSSRSQVARSACSLAPSQRERAEFLTLSSPSCASYLPLRPMRAAPSRWRDRPSVDDPLLLGRSTMIFRPTGMSVYASSDRIDLWIGTLETVAKKQHTARFGKSRRLPLGRWEQLCVRPQRRSRTLQNGARMELITAVCWRINRCRVR